MLAENRGITIMLKHDILLTYIFVSMDSKSSESSVYKNKMLRK